MSILSMLKKQIADELGEGSQISPECQKGLVARFRYDMEHQYRQILTEPDKVEVDHLLTEAEERIDTLLTGV